MSVTIFILSELLVEPACDHMHRNYKHNGSVRPLSCLLISFPCTLLYVSNELALRLLLISFPCILLRVNNELLQTLFTWKSKLRSWGYEPIFCSVESKYGIDTLQFNLREQTSVIVGPSGVGKSSLINALRNNKNFVGIPEQNNWFDPVGYPL